MKHKIGEIVLINKEWYQCVEGRCKDCYFSEKRYLCKQFITKDICTSHIIYKKLEKVGEPYLKGNVTYQRYKLYEPHRVNMMKFDTVDLEVKQNKEDMEEKKLIELLSEKVHNAWMKEKEAQGFSYGKEYDKEKKKHPDMLPYNELKEEVKEYDRATVKAVLQAQKELSTDANKLSFKEFNLEAAKAGKPVCTRDGRKARIVCFDRRNSDNCHIVALIEDKGSLNNEVIKSYYNNGKYLSCDEESPIDLMMLPEKKEGWINVYVLNTYYSSKEEAEANIDRDYEHEYIRTVKISWEE